MIDNIDENKLYRIIKTIKDEELGEVFLISYLCTKDENNLYIMKRLYINTDEEKYKILENLEKLKNVDYKYIIKLHDYFIEHIDDKEIICIIIDYYDNSNNLERIIYNTNILNSRNIWRIFIQLILGLKSLDSNNIIIKDLYPQNIYLDSVNNIIIGGLGLILQLTYKGIEDNKNKHENIDDKESIILGKNEINKSSYYISPEILKGEKYDNKSYIWSLGCILYEIQYKKKLFEGKDFKENILSINYNLPEEEKDDYLKILPKLLCEKERRLAINELIFNSIFKKKVIEVNIFTEIVKNDLKSKEINVNFCIIFNFTYKYRF